MKTLLIVSLLSLSNISFAQQAPPPFAASADMSDTVTKVVRVRNGTATKIADLVTGGGMPVAIRGDNVLNVIVLRGAPNLVASLEQTIRELDVPVASQLAKVDKDIELIVSVIGASDKAELLPEGQISETLVPVVKQLRAAFPYKNYQLLSPMLLRSRNGGTAGNSGIMKSLGNIDDQLQPSRYSVTFDQVGVSTEQGKLSIYVRKFRFDIKVPFVTGKSKNNNGTYSPTEYQSFDVGITTDVNLQEGQKVVVGKANIGNSDLALFAVLSARLVE